jgi:predicted SprT family Zn-dependent metalloprotease
MPSLSTVSNPVYMGVPELAQVMAIEKTSETIVAKTCQCKYPRTRLVKPDPDGKGGTWACARCHGFMFIHRGFDVRTDGFEDE